MRACMKYKQKAAGNHKAVFVLNLRMSGETTLRNNIVAVINCDTRYSDEGNLKRQTKNPTF